jgi:hypothetical protein
MAQRGLLPAAPWNAQVVGALPQVIEEAVVGFFHRVRELSHGLVINLGWVEAARFEIVTSQEQHEPVLAI